MKIIKPSVEIIHEPDNMKRIELAGRVCYKSEDKIAEGSAERFCKMLIRRGHTAMLEHGNIIVRVEFLSDEYHIISFAVRAYEGYTRKPCMLRWVVDDIGDCVFSGNVRAWRDLLGLGAWSICFNADPLFADLLRGKLDLDAFRISAADLTAEKRDCHDILTARFVCAEGVSLEMFRHRMAVATYEEAPAVCLSPAQESSRYVDYSDEMLFVEPWWWEEKPEWRERFCISCWDSETHYGQLRKMGAPPEAARAALTKAIKTEIILTQTPERWRDWLKLREDKAAHPDMRVCARMFREAMGWTGGK